MPIILSFIQYELITNKINSCKKNNKIKIININTIFINILKLKIYENKNIKYKKISKKIFMYN